MVKDATAIAKQTVSTSAPKHGIDGRVHRSPEDSDSSQYRARRQPMLAGTSMKAPKCCSGRGRELTSASVQIHSIYKDVTASSPTGADSELTGSQGGTAGASV